VAVFPAAKMREWHKIPGRLQATGYRLQVTGRMLFL
jgi:hypothetical protein